MTTHRTEEVRGTLVDGQGKNCDVLLDLTVAQLRGDHGVDDEGVADVSITFGVRIPADGVYTLHYMFHNKPYQEQVRLQERKVIRGILF